MSSAFAVQPLNEAGLWAVRYVGDITLGIRQKALAHFVHVSTGHPVLGILVDLRRSQLKLSMADAFEFGNNLASERGLGQCRLVFLENTASGTPSRFMVNVARNRGRDTRVFTDENQAIAWLMEAPTRAEELPQGLLWPPALTGS